MTAAAAELTLSSLLSLILLLSAVLVMPAEAAEWDRSSLARAEAGPRKYGPSSSSSSDDGGSGSLRFEDFHGAGKEASSNPSFTYSFLRCSRSSPLPREREVGNKPRRSLVAALFCCSPERMMLGKWRSLQESKSGLLSLLPPSS